MPSPSVRSDLSRAHDEQPTRTAAGGAAPDGGTAVVYCEGNFGAIDGKTANGLVRHSERYEILSVIDSGHAGLDAGEVLDGTPNGISICTDLAAAVALAGSVPDFFIFGVAPTSGMLSPVERQIVLQAIGLGMNIVNGLHEFLNEDPEFVTAAAATGVAILDVRRPRDKKDLHMFSGRIDSVTCPRIAVLGTDGAIGKRTTATILTKALNDRGIKAVLVGTGQTGLIQGARYGVALDAIPCQFCSGEMEHAVVEAFEGEHPDVIIIEGQGALSHPAYLSSTFILRGSRPHAVVLQHAPARKRLGDFGDVVAPTPASEINLIQTFADTQVIGLTLNHEHMTDAEVDAAITMYELELGIPATDALTRSPDRLVEMVLGAFPELGQELANLGA
ncbi:MAG: nuclear protein [Acidimicrobiales bacterium]|nr:nuclear protein [Acidimicrobiales bacterium]